jgi:broad specificity phosphatase PhoE
MSELSRIVLVRHGETVGRSSVRFYGSTDVALSPEGCAQMRQAAGAIAGGGVGLVVASPLGRAWKAATIVAPGRPIRLEPGFREIDFGHWEGLTREEIEARDPIRYREWQARGTAFEFPSGERRAPFRARVRAAVEGLLASGQRSVMVVSHKGVIREIVLQLTGEPLEEGEPALGGVVRLSRGADGSWLVARPRTVPQFTRRPVAGEPGR